MNTEGYYEERMIVMTEPGSVALDRPLSPLALILRFIAFSIIVSMYLALSFITYNYAGPLLPLILLPIVLYVYSLLFPRREGDGASSSRNYGGFEKLEYSDNYVDRFAFHFEVNPDTGHYDHSHSGDHDSCQSEAFDAGYTDCDCYF
jgi:hypothetical protein